MDGSSCAEMDGSDGGSSPFHPRSASLPRPVTRSKESKLVSPLRRPIGPVGVRCRTPMQGLGQRAIHTEDWDDRHHLLLPLNQQRPKRLRSYFSRPQSLPELREDLSLSGLPGTRSLLRRLRSEELAKPTTPITADAAPSLAPERHIVGGHMPDRQGRILPWNQRWHKDIYLFNDKLHPLHRSYFDKCSLLTRAPSQHWRRFNDIEVKPGIWTNPAGPSTSAESENATETGTAPV